MEEAEKSRGCRNIGLDIHQYYSVVAGVDREGEDVLSSCRVEHADLEEWLVKHLLPSERVVIERTTNLFLFTPWHRD